MTFQPPNNNRYLHPSTTRGPPRSHPYMRNTHPGDGRGNQNRPLRMEHDQNSDRFKKSGFPPELNKLMGPLECKLCEVESTSPIAARMHYSGKSHARKVKRFMEEYCNRNGLPMPEIEASTSAQANESSFLDYCEICDVSMTSENDKILHFSGKSHRKNELDPENAKRKKKSTYTVDVSGRFGIGMDFTSASSVEECPQEDKLKIHHYVCELCDVQAVSQEQLQAHLAGKKHKDKLEKQEKMVVDGVQEEGKPFKCNLCDVALATKPLYDLHINGKRHAKLMNKVEMKGVDFCKVCNISFTSMEHYEAHMAGKKHAKMSKKELIETITKQRGETVSIACKFCPYIGNVDNHNCDQSLLKKFNEVENLDSRWACCNMLFENNYELDEHKKSRRHVLISLNKDGDEIIDELKHWYCITCRVQYKNNHEFTEHLFQEKHMTLSVEEQFLVANKDIFQCLACNLFLDINIKDEHEKDRKHIENALRKDIQDLLKNLASKELNKPIFFCENCNVILHGLEKYSEHLLCNDHIETSVQFKLRQLD